MKTHVEEDKNNADMLKKIIQQGEENSNCRVKTYNQRYSIAFKDVPFLPERDQVIYVESVFDEKVNGYIRDNYNKLQIEFKKHNLEFVYLPLYFNAAELEEKIRYYAPYLFTGINKPKVLSCNSWISIMVN